MRLRTWLSSLVLLPVLLAPLAAKADALYTVTLLPAGFSADDINNAGQIAGYLATPDGTTHAALYAGGSVTGLGIFGGAPSFATAINETGMVTGNATIDGWTHAFLYSAAGTFDLGPGTYGLGINAWGDVVGQKSNDSGYVSFLYSGGTLSEIGNLGTGTVGLANDINDAGEIVGESEISAEFHAPFHPYLYRDGVLHDLGTLGGFENNSAGAINNAGLIAGYSTTSTGLNLFTYQDGMLQDAGSFDPLELTVDDINEHGAFVGNAAKVGSGNGGPFGYVFLHGAAVDLNTLIDAASGWQISGASGINDLGQIVGYGCVSDSCGAVRLDLAGAVPEPASALLLVPGLLVLAGKRRGHPATHCRPLFHLRTLTWRNRRAASSFPHFARSICLSVDS
jgi:probable HAF family extracellular repeat protein